MKIVTIFEQQLYAFQYTNSIENEYDRLMSCWISPVWLYNFCERNYISNKSLFIQQIIQDAEQIQNFLENLRTHAEYFTLFFEPLQQSEVFKMMSFQKGKVRRNKLRFYAIKIDENCFVITGGAIKLTMKMQEHEDTRNELIKLKQARAFFSKNNVIDQASFFELINEQQ